MPGNPVSFEQPLGALQIIGGSRMVKRFKLKAIVFVPLAGTDVQFVHATFRVPWRCGDALVESLPQQIGKEMVIAVPTPLVVQGDDEQVGAFKLFEDEGRRTMDERYAAFVLHLSSFA